MCCINVRITYSEWPKCRISFLYNKTNQLYQFLKFTPAWNTCFGQFPCPSSGVYSLYTQKWYMSYRFVDSFWAGPGWNAMFRTVRLSIIRSLFTVHSAMVYVNQICRHLSSRTRMELQFHPGPVIQVCRQLSSRNRMEFQPGHARKLSTNLYDMYHYWVYSK